MSASLSWSTSFILKVGFDTTPSVDKFFSPNQFGQTCNAVMIQFILQVFL